MVEWQVRVARGERLPKLQDELSIHGHSLEVRVYAEDTLNGFIPDIGTLNRYRRPRKDLARVDDAFEEGMEVPIYYDPMIAKLVVWGETREEAIEKMIKAINNYEISGLKTTLDFGKFVMMHPAFRSGDFDTNFVKHYFQDPTVMWDMFKDEKAALEAGIEKVWEDLKEKTNKNAASRNITSTWKLHAH
ncbi:2-oxoglutarate carboxylase small subunit [compost metagenome]